MPDPAAPEPALSPRTVADLLALLRQHRLVVKAHPAEVEMAALPAEDGPTLLRGMVSRGWLTAYQANEINLGRAASLTLGSYVLLDKLGQGGMGQVFKAFHRNLHRTDAIKVIRPDLMGPPALARFQREARATAQLNHPNLVTVYDAGEADGRHYLAMEYIEGTDLAKLAQRRGPLPVLAVCQVLHQASLALQHADEKGLVHRDVKPSNLMLSAGGVVKLLDLGLACLHSEEASADTRLTASQQLIGTPDFIAPEQALSARNADIRADLYSLGCTCYFILAGCVPFPGGDALDKLVRQRVEQPRPLSEARPDVPPALAAIVSRLMAKAPQDRFQTPSELALAIRPVLDALAADGTSIRLLDGPEDVVQVLLAPGPESAAPTRNELPPPPTVIQPPQAHRWPGLITGSLAVLLLLVLSLAFLPFACPRGDSPSSGPPTAPTSWRAGPSFRCAGPSALGVLFLPDGRVVVTSGDLDKPTNKGAVQLLSPNTGALASLPYDGPALTSVALLDGGKSLAAATGFWGEGGPLVPGKVYFFDLETETAAGSVESRVTIINAMLPSPDGDGVIVSGREGGLEVLSRNGKKPRWIIPPGDAILYCASLALPPDGRLLAVGGGDGSVRLFRTGTWAPEGKWAPIGGNRPVITGVSFLPEGELAGSTAVSADPERQAQVRLWDEDIKKVVWKADHGGWHIVCQALSPDGSTLATADAGAHIRLWGLKGRRELAAFDDPDRATPQCLSFSPDARTLALALGNGTVRLFHGEGP
jgi:serine/threonine protein kinase